MLKRSTARLAAVLALTLPAAMLHAAPGAQAAAAPVVLYDQTSGATTPSADSSAPNFSPSNHFEEGDTDRTADDFTVPAGASWALSEIAVTGAFEGGAPGTGTVNVYVYANDAGKPGAELFSQLGVAASGGPSFVVPLTGAPALTAGTYWVSVQYDVGAGPYWSWGTTSVQRGNSAQWRSSNNETPCGADAWGPRTTCWPGTNPDQVFVLKGTDLTSNDITLGKPRLNKATGTAKLPATVPNAGKIVVKGKGVVRRAAAAAGAGTLRLKVKAKGAAKVKLNETGKVTLKVKVTFTPTGGVAKTVTKKVTLKKVV